MSEEKRIVTPKVSLNPDGFVALAVVNNGIERAVELPYRFGTKSIGHDVREQVQNALAGKGEMPKIELEEIGTRKVTDYRVKVNGLGITVASTSEKLA